MLNEVRAGPSFGSGLLQFILAFFAPVVVTVIMPQVVAIPLGPWLALFEYVSIGLVACLLGFLVFWGFPKTPVEGRWVWILPAVLEFTFLALSLRNGKPPVIQMFYTKPGEGEGGWIMVMLTYPTWGICWYSLTMWCLKRRASLKLGGE